MSDKVPTIKTLLKLVSNKGLSAAQWMEIGIKLQLEHSTLEEIEWSYPRSPERCLIEVLHRWLNYHVAEVTMKEFQSALR